MTVDKSAQVNAYLSDQAHFQSTYSFTELQEKHKLLHSFSSALHLHI